MTKKRTVQSLLLGLLSYLFPFKNTRLSMYWDSRRERTALVDCQPVDKTDVQKLPTMLELRENGGRRDGTHDSAIHWHQHCLGRVDVMCNKLDNTGSHL